jgi:type I restriction enzyme M protein
MTDEQKKKLEQKLWDIANTLRGKMNADEFRDYILGFIFYKYLSERLHIYANSILTEDGIDFAEIKENTDEGRAYLQAVSDAAVEQLGYFLKPSELFRAVAKRGSQQGQFILEDLSRILNNVERSTMGTESEDDFDDLFSDMDLTSSKLGRTEEAKNTLITKVLTHLDEIDFDLANSKSDVLGDAYEYLIGQFASGAGKKAGEFYTPQEVSTILARIVTTGKTRLKTVYDPTCGSGSLLLRVAKEATVGDFFGQEMNRTTYNLARMNMILHGIHYRNFNLKQEDTLEHPQHADKRFEAVVANPPFSAQWSANSLLLTDDRYAQYGRLAPASKADFAFVQHMLHQLDDNGTMAVILPHGVLFRGAAEGHIREYIIKERNWLDAVIGLPANIFYGTSIPTCILVFKKCREWPEDILFVDASTCFEKAKNQNVLLPEHIDRIVTAYRTRAVEPRFSHRAKLSEVAENDYNLNIPRYVDTFEAEAQIDLAAVAAELKANANGMAALDAQIAAFCAELGIEAPV